MLPLNVTDYGVTSDSYGDNFYIFFYSKHSKRTLYLGENELHDSPEGALRSTDINFVTKELVDLLKDKDFMSHLEARFAF